MGVYYGKDKDDNLLKLIILSIVSMSLVILLSISISAVVHPIDLPRTVTGSSYLTYDYQNVNRFYSIYFQDDFNTGEAVRFMTDGYYVSYDLSGGKIQWFEEVGNPTKTKSIGAILSSSPNINSNLVSYPDAFIGTDVQYSLEKEGVKEIFVLNSYPAVDGSTYLYLEYTGDLRFSPALTIYANGEDQTDKSFQTTGAIELKEISGNTIFTLPPPTVEDSNGDFGTAYYNVKPDTGKLTFGLRVNRSWMDTAVFPIYIDPTFQVDYTPIPAEHLIDGNYYTYPDYDYTTITDITSEMSDSNTSTYVEVFRSALTGDLSIATAIKFEETSGNISKDYGFFGIDVDLYNSPNLNIIGAFGSGIDFDGINDYGIVPRYVNLSILTDNVFCLALSDGGIGSIETFIDNKGGGNAQGMEFTLTSSDTLDFFVRRGAVQTTLSGTIAVDDGTWHKACGVTLANGTVELWLDGVKDVSATGIIGAMNTIEYIYLGASHTQGQLYSQKLDEVCSWRGIGLDEQALIQEYNDTFCGQTEGDHIGGSWNLTYDGNYSWFLGLNKISSGTDLFFVNAYDDLENVSSVTTIGFSSGTGEFYIPIDSLMNYMTNTQGLSYTKLRITSSDNSNISEIYIRQEGNDTQIPAINTCYTNTTTLDCDETARLECNITDDFAIYLVDFQINLTNYTATQRDTDFWYYDLSPTGMDVSEIYDWDYVFAHDYVNNTNITDPNIQINYTCVTPCLENWTLDPYTCLINDTYFALYTDQTDCGTVDDLPAQNGTEQYCNYCSEDLIAIFGVCQSNSSQSVSWHDNNFFSCCLITSFSSDCSIMTYPYNETTYQNCTFYTQDLGTPICPEEFTFKTEEREYCLVSIPQNYTNESFKCMAFVVTDTPTEIVQVTPEYKERAETFFDFWRGEPESREYFTPANGFVNVYITKKNLLPEYDYFLHISCKSDQRTLESVHPFTIGYESVEFVFFRTRWLMANAGYIIGGILLLFIILAILIFLFKGVK